MSARYGIMGAMPEEVRAIGAMVDGARRAASGGREFISGSLHGHDAVVVHSRWGKVAAAITAAELILVHRVDALLFTGVAGAVDPGLTIGDAVIGDTLYQHDLDASPIYPRMEIPGAGTAALPADPELSRRLDAAARSFVQDRLERVVDAATLARFGIRGAPAVRRGIIATGDRFIRTADDAASLRAAIPGVLCVEMEGAAVAQVCHDHRVPFAVLRVISDRADHLAPVDFTRFVGDVAACYTAGIVDDFLAAL